MPHDDFNMLNNTDTAFYELASIIPSWKAGTVVRYIEKGRSEDMLFYLIKGKWSYSGDGQEAHEYMSIHSGDIIFAPAGSHYISRFCASSPGDISSGICLKFDIREKDGRKVVIPGLPSFIHHDADGRFYDLFLNLHKTIMRGKGEKLHSKALLSQLIDDLITSSRREKSFSRALLPLYPAIEKIEQFPQEHTPIPELAAMCYLSESTFRRKFRRYTGVSPAGYRSRIRIQKAVELLESGFYTIEETAEAMGFSDQAYLCNVIRKYTGKTPGEHKKSRTGGMTLE